MYLIDTNVISEARKRAKANPGVIALFENVAAAADEFDATAQLADRDSGKKHWLA